MKSIRTSSRLSAFAGAIALLFLISPLGAHDNKKDHDDDPGERHYRNRPVDIKFTKWVLASPAGAMAGFIGGDPTVAFVGHVFHQTLSFNGHVRRLEAMYEVVHGDLSFSALIRGGQNASGAALLDGFILAGWRTGAPVHVEFQQMAAPSPTEPGCVGAPPGIACYEGTIHIGRVPRND